MNRQLFFRIGKKDRPEIIEVRHRFFNWVMYPFLIFGLLATILGGLQSYQQGRWVFSVLYAACYLIFGFTTFLGRYISLFIRSIVTIMTLVAFSILILLRIGLSGIGLEVLLLACGISSALLGRRIGYVITSIGVLAMLVIGGSMVSGMLPIWEETMLTSLSPLAWGTSIIVFLMSGLALVTLPQMFLGRLEESLTLLEERAGELERSNVSMKKTIEAREKAEKALKESEEKYRILVENAGDAIFIAQNGLLRFVNNKATELSGRTHDELISKNFNDIIHKEDRELVIERHKKRQQGIEVPSNYSFRIINKSGDVKWVELNAVRIEWHGAPATLNFLRDITERMQTEKILRESEERLARSKKMESLGLLAGGVAHDLNNVLAGIVSYPELLLLDLPEESRLRKPIETIQKSGQNAAAIVQDLLTIARGVAITKKPLNLNDLINEYLNSPEFKKLKQLHPTVTIKFDFDRALLNVTGSHIHIKKAVMNLVANAAEAIEEKGEITISTINRYLDRPLRGYDDVKTGEYAIVSVSDNGPGISPNDLERIFEPFYTKKIMGRSGTGLGLAVVWNVMLDHHGYINVTTNKKETTFELYFPITRDGTLEKDLSMPIEEYRGNGETILVVDDVESQRIISCGMLNRLGYKTEAVSSGEEAIEYLKGNTVDLLLLDMIMDKGINGRETYERVIEIRPNQKAVLVSGFAETDEVKKAQNIGAGKYIKKPLTLRELGLAVKEELAK